MSDRMPEDLPVRKCINVMVGITRSKVFFWGVYKPMVILYQWPCNRNRWKLEVPIPYIRPMFQGYVREYTPKIWPYMVQYLHFRILEFPLICWFITPTRWCPRSESLSWGPHNSSFTLVYRWYIELINGVYKPINITREAPPCMNDYFIVIISPTLKAGNNNYSHVGKRIS